jgi:hypothetical protein
MNKFALLSLMLLTCLIVQSQNSFTAKQLKAGQLPTGIRYRGTLTEAYEWKDSLGKNLLILSNLAPYASAGDDPDAMTSELFAVHYNFRDTGYQVRWRLNDLVKECPLDMNLNFIKGSTSITDLDKDGVAETTVQYRLACRGDVSPSAMKLIMHEDSAKFALRGTMWLDGAAPDTKFTITTATANLSKQPKPKEEFDAYLQSFGRYENENEFKSAPPQFLQYARKRWVQFAKESL